MDLGTRLIDFFLYLSFSILWWIVVLVATIRLGQLLLLFLFFEKIRSYQQTSFEGCQSFSWEGESGMTL